MSKNIYFTADTHWNHKNIVRGVTAWSKENQLSIRNFDTLEEHNAELIKRFNSLVKCDDVLYHLGDWSFGGHENIQKFRNQLHCRNIQLIFGNHDQHIEPIDSPYRGCFSSCQYVKQVSLKIDSAKSGRMGKQGFFLSHYGHRVWNQLHHGVIHLYGHSHGSLPGIGRSMDVGVDTNNLYPYYLDEILDKFKNVPVNYVDHHNKDTN